MGVDIYWLIEDKIIQVDASGEITIEQIQDSSARIIQMFNQSDSPLVHLLVNEAEVKSLPISLKTFSEAASFLRHPQMGWMIMFGTDNLMSKFMSSMIAGIAKVRHRRFETFDDSLEFLLTVDSSLPSIEDIHKQVNK